MDSEGNATKHLVVVGNGMVGHKLLEYMRDRGLLQSWDITVFGAELHHAYDRVSLSSYAHNAQACELSLASSSDNDDITLFLGDPIVSIDRASKKVRSASGASVAYDALVLATGSIPVVPPVPGADARGCHLYRTLDDIDRIRSDARSSTTGVVIGGGLLGLEAANALQAFGLTTHIVEMAPWLLPIQVDQGGGSLVARHVEALGVNLHLSTRASRIITDSTGKVCEVELASGETIPTDLVIFSVGVRPEDSLARSSGLELGDRGGVLTNQSCLTSDPNIFAIGECASIQGQTYGLVAPGYAMAETVADQLGGIQSTFRGADTSTKLKLLGVEVASFGDAFAKTNGALEVIYADHVSGIYKKLVVSDDARHVLGGVLVGDASSYATLRSMAVSQSELTAEPERYLFPNAEPVPLLSLTDTAIVCSCHNVSAASLRCALRDGCEDISSLKAATKAATGCGSCLPLVKSLLSDELILQGKELSNALCEHFSQSRRELVELIQVGGLTSFSSVVSRFGEGLGCDICKPVVASILASRAGSHPLDSDSASLQDTNDHVLANLQKDGSYSVVPRIPGGEITPDGLMLIGAVAKEFGLYTKITGAQRIDLFGARIDQLPSIWSRLVDAGFESGHAYGKAVRTVKSCVGSTWCRYGVQDSVSLAIALELRYRGLRAPHKIKAGVSGCARECAEAKSKDIGVIATEAGWNLYVAGNGGFTPRHADLLVSDVDSETLVRYIDRFLMYYIRTAERLQRTAAWVQSIDGGLDHVRDVVVNDSLGLAEDLETAMQEHVAQYSDEWKETLQDPDKLAHFVSFVNAPEAADPSISFVPQRNQHRPALWADKASAESTPLNHPPRADHSVRTKVRIR